MEYLLKRAYQNKTILVTGHTGFKGAWLSQWLTLLGAKVVGYALPPPKTETHNLFNALQLSQTMRSHFGDVNDFSDLNAFITDCQPDVIFHMAAQALVRHSYQHPIDTFATNVLGTVHVLEAARHCTSVKAIINITTDKCYENKEWVWGYREIDRLGGRDPYSTSKACAELVTTAYRHSFFADSTTLALASARAGNVIGGGDWSRDRLLPDIVQALHQNQPVVLRNPQALRPWQHVLDALYGYLLIGVALLEQGHEYASAWNFGPEDAELFPVEKLAQQALQWWGKGKIVISSERHALHEAKLLRLDASKARSQLNWRPHLDTRTAVQMTMEWYRAYLDKVKSAAEITQEQIAAYMEKITNL